MRIRCPHCHQRVEIVGEDPLAEMNCPSCGSSFHLISGDSTTTYRRHETRTLGHFELLEPLGQGHIGSVWKGRDLELDRIVAVKIPRKEHLDPSEVELFLREARAAAQLSHPNIVPVHEVGSEQDTVYIVSDYVEGLTLADWLTGQQLSPREAAELCIKLAEGLHHAHQAGVVHRDLKPSNIMLDADGEPHIMDFGLAKREAGEITVTVDGRILGTPAYMSPEQASGSAHAADRRSDVYSLGVILFELLSGERPFRGNTRMLLHQVVSDDAPSPRRFNSRIPRDLETICLKCLEKDPRRRYPTAKELADELRRFLEGKPIHARPITRLHRGWRKCKRNPVVSSLTAALIAVLVTGIAGATWQWIRAEAHAARETRAREQTEREKTKAEQQYERAEKNFQLTRDAVDKYFVRVSNSPQLKARGLEKLRRGLLEAAQQFYEEFLKQNPADPKLQAERGRGYLRLGVITAELGDTAEAEKAYRAAIDIFERLAAEHPDVPEYQDGLGGGHNNLGVLYRTTGRREEAEKAYLAAMAIQERLAAEHPDVPEYQANLATSHNNLGNLYRTTGRREEAEKAYLGAIEIQERLAAEHPDVPEYQAHLASSHNNLGILYRTTGRLEEAEKAYLTATGIKERLAAEHPDVPEYQESLASSHGNLGNVYKNTDRLEQAEAEYQAAAEIHKRLAVKHPDVPEYQDSLASSHGNVGNLYRTAGRREEAGKAHLAAMEIQQRLAAEHPDVPEYQDDLARSHYNLGNLYRTSGRREEAEAAYQRAIEIRKHLTAEHPDVPEYQNKLAQRYDRLGALYETMGRPEEAAKARTAAAEIRKRLLPDWPSSIGEGKSPPSLELHLVPIRRGLWEQRLSGLSVQARKDNPLLKAAGLAGADIESPKHPLLIHSFENGRLFYLFYNVADSALGDRAFLIQRVRKVERNYLNPEDTAPKTQETFSVEVMQIVAGRTRKADQHYANYNLGAFYRREVLKEFEIGFGEVEGIIAGRAWPFEPRICYKQLQGYDPDRSVYDKVDFTHSKKWTLSVSFDRDGNYDISVPELNIHAPSDLPDPESVLPQPDRSTVALVLDEGRGLLGLAVGESTAEDIEAVLGPPLHIEPINARSANYVHRSALVFNLYYHGPINTISTRPGFAGKTSKGIAHGDTRARVIEVYGAPPGSKNGPVLTYEGVIFWLDCDDRVEKIVVWKRGLPESGG